MLILNGVRRELLVDLDRCAGHAELILNEVLVRGCYVAWRPREIGDLACRTTPIWFALDQPLSTVSSTGVLSGLAELVHIALSTMAAPLTGLLGDLAHMHMKNPRPLGGEISPFLL